MNRKEFLKNTLKGAAAWLMIPYFFQVGAGRHNRRESPRSARSPRVNPSGARDHGRPDLLRTSHAG